MKSLTLEEGATLREVQKAQTKDAKSVLTMVTTARAFAESLSAAGVPEAKNLLSAVDLTLKEAENTYRAVLARGGEMEP